MIDPHVHGGLAQVIVVLGGGVDADLEHRTVNAPAPAALVIPAGAVHGFRFRPGTDGFVVSFADGMLDASPLGGWVRRMLFDRGDAFALDADEARRIGELASQLHSEHATTAAGSDVVSGSLLQACLVVLARCADRADAAQPPAAGPAEVHRRFRGLVEERFVEHWPVARYARELGVSSSTLDRVCRRFAGVSAFEVTQERLELEARRRLRYTGVPVQQIAHDLGFVDASYFARFVRRRTGSPPSAHRGHRSG